MVWEVSDGVEPSWSSRRCEWVREVRTDPVCVGGRGTRVTYVGGWCVCVRPQWVIGHPNTSLPQGEHDLSYFFGTTPPVSRCLCLFLSSRATLSMLVSCPVLSSFPVSFPPSFCLCLSVSVTPLPGVFFSPCDRTPKDPETTTRHHTRRESGCSGSREPVGETRTVVLSMI